MITRLCEGMENSGQTIEAVSTLIPLFLAGDKDTIESRKLRTAVLMKDMLKELENRQRITVADIYADNFPLVSDSGGGSFSKPTMLRLLLRAATGDWVDVLLEARDQHGTRIASKVGQLYVTGGSDNVCAILTSIVEGSYRGEAGMGDLAAMIQRVMKMQLYDSGDLMFKILSEVRGWLNKDLQAQLTTHNKKVREQVFAKLGEPRDRR